MSLIDWTTRERPGREPLSGVRVILEPLDWAVHLEGLFSAVAGPQNADIWTYMPIGPCETREAFQKIFSLVQAKAGWEPLVIRNKDSGKILGMASYMRIREEHGSAEIGCVAFGDDLKRTPEATEAMFLMAAYAFDELGYRRYEWKCHNENAASKRAALRFGFAFEGIFRNDMVLAGKNRDTAWFAMTDGDWPSLKKGYKVWLEPENFHAYGRQKRSLAELRVA
jgi:RimJ/RimL family protein N-acetyltransferase